MALAETINRVLQLDLTERSILIMGGLIGEVLIEERNHNAMPPAAQPRLELEGGGRRPKFYSDIEVREHLIRLHREATIAQARASCLDRFGPERCPSSSAIGRFWLQLDTARRRR
jgi:hypothetical protein